MTVHESRSVLRTLDLLETLGRTEQPLTLTEAARATQIDPSTAYRLLRVLCRRGFVHREPATRRYSLGFGTFRLGAQDVVVQSIGRHAQIHLLRLASDIGETTRLAVLEGSDVRFCAEAGVYERPGSRLHLLLKLLSKPDCFRCHETPAPSSSANTATSQGLAWRETRRRHQPLRSTGVTSPAPFRARRRRRCRPCP